MPNSNITVSALLAILANALPIFASTIDATKHPQAAMLVSVLVKLVQSFTTTTGVNATAFTAASATAPVHTVTVSSLPTSHAPDALLAWAASKPSVATEIRFPVA